MNVLSLLTKEKHVAGLEIDEGVVRILFFRNRKGDSLLFRENALSSAEKDLVLIEESIPQELVQEGKVTDPQALGEVLSKIWQKAHLNTRYAIVAIPDDTIYSKIFTFPPSVDKARVTEAMELASTFQLPFEENSVYSDWEIISTSERGSEVLFSAIRKEITEGFVTALSIAGIRPLALESHLDSVARAIDCPPNTPLLYTKEMQDDSSVFIVKDNYVRFSRALPTRFVSKSKFKAEVQKVKTSFEASAGFSGVTLEPKKIETAKLREEHLQWQELSDDPARWFVALGTALRGALPEGEDNLISLLPVKTEEAYLYQKAVTFMVLVRNITIGVALFFTVSFSVMYFVMLSLSQTANRSIASLSSAPISSELLANEATVKSVNELTTTSKLILSEMPLWSTVLEELSVRTISGIRLSNFSAQTFTGTISISGAASDRTTLNQFKKTLQESPLFTEVELPITNLEQKENIAFSMSFKVKDPATLYYK